ncbi:MAG: Na(+)/H(+) antiporter subunit D [Opitutae bacterium]|nr:Na(+)/H(+) antiporter subunit D [Opitutae bacterium]
MLLVGGALVPLLQGRWRQLFVIFIPVAGLVNLWGIDAGEVMEGGFLGLELIFCNADKMALLFGLLFHIAAFICALYSLHVKDVVQTSTGMMYAGSAVGAVFAGDFITLFFFWELLAVTSVFQIWARKSAESYGAGQRYLMLHVLSGLLLLGGVALQYHETGSLVVRQLVLGGLASWLIFLAIGIKCAFPGLHSWVVDAYPAGTPTGTVFLCCFTTKVAVCTLARTFAGTELLIWIGSIMALLPIFYAVIENDLRRVLGYSMINQLGFMVVGIGIGTSLSLNGTCAHVFAHVLYKSLLFMSMGAVLMRTGRINGSDLGGLYKTMPWTAGFCIIGAASISAFPLFSGFVSKSLIMSAAAQEGYLWIWFILLFAAAGVFHHAGIKIPFFAFYHHDTTAPDLRLPTTGIQGREAPLNMLCAMGIGAFFCIFIGCNPSFLYDMLPMPINYEPYTTSHVIAQLQLLCFSALAFAGLQMFKLYPPELRSTNLDADWFYRKGLALVNRFLDLILNGINVAAKSLILGRTVPFFIGFLNNLPSHLMAWLQTPQWGLWSGRNLQVRDNRKSLREAAFTGVFPVGFGALAAVIIFGVLFFAR